MRSVPAWPGHTHTHTCCCTTHACMHAWPARHMSYCGEGRHGVQWRPSESRDTISQAAAASVHHSIVPGRPLLPGWPALAPCHCCHRRAAGTVVGAAPIVNARTGGARGRVRTYARAGHKDGDLIHRPEARHGSVLTPARALPRRRATARGHSPARRKRRRPCLSLSLSLSVPSALASCSVIAPRRAAGIVRGTAGSSSR
jgi:hypothetical protein